MFKCLEYSNFNICVYIDVFSVDIGFDIKFCVFLLVFKFVPMSISASHSYRADLSYQIGSKKFLHVETLLLIETLLFNLLIRGIEDTLSALLRFKEEKRKNWFI